MNKDVLLLVVVLVVGIGDDSMTAICHSTSNPVLSLRMRRGEEGGKEEKVWKE